MSDDITYLRAAGIDIGKSEAVVCVRSSAPGSSRPKTQTQRFPTTQKGIREMRAWLVDCEVQCAVMESTSAYWTSIWNGLQDAGFELIPESPMRSGIYSGVY